jgi:hypothetical protein
MMHRIKAICFVLAAVLTSPAWGAGDRPVKGTYHVIEVDRFDAVPGVSLPANYEAELAGDLARQLEEKGFQRVLKAGENPHDSSPALRLTGTVTKFQKGSRALRYLSGFAGKTKIVAHIKVADRHTGQVLYETDADGKVVIGVFGGDSMGATNGLAKEIANKVRKHFF